MAARWVGGRGSPPSLRSRSVVAFWASVRVRQGGEASQQARDRVLDAAPAGRALEIHVTNLNAIPSEFESGDLHFEKIVPAGKEAVVRVRPQQPGRYTFFDDFHRETKGALVVP